MHTEVLKCNPSYNEFQLQYSIKTLVNTIVHKILKIVVMHKKCFKYSSPNRINQLPQYKQQKM